MKSLTAGMPAEIAQRIHPDWHKNEKDCWSEREKLLSEFFHQWIAFANGAVLFSGNNPAEVLRAALESAQHPFVTCVGNEHEPWCRMRRSVFPCRCSRLSSLCAGPFISRDISLAEDPPNERRIDRDPVGIGDRETQTAPAHPLELASRERPFEVKLLQLAHQLTP